MIEEINISHHAVQRFFERIDKDQFIQEAVNANLGRLVTGHDGAEEVYFIPLSCNLVGIIKLDSPTKCEIVTIIDLSQLARSLRNNRYTIDLQAAIEHGLINDSLMPGLQCLSNK